MEPEHEAKQEGQDAPEMEIETPISIKRSEKAPKKTTKQPITAKQLEALEKAREVRKLKRELQKNEAEKKPSHKKKISVNECVADAIESATPTHEVGGYSLPNEKDAPPYYGGYSHLRCTEMDAPAGFEILLERLGNLERMLKEREEKEQIKALPPPTPPRYSHPYEKDAPPRITIRRF